jgi:hypothetical protein
MLPTPCFVIAGQYRSCSSGKACLPPFHFFTRPLCTTIAIYKLYRTLSRRTNFVWHICLQTPSAILKAEVDTYIILRGFYINMLSCVILIYFNKVSNVYPRVRGRTLGWDGFTLQTLRLSPPQLYKAGCGIDAARTPLFCDIAIAFHCRTSYGRWVDTSCGYS